MNRLFSRLGRLGRSFPVRLYWYITVPMVFFGLLLTYFSVRSQASLLGANLLQHGLTVAQLLADDLRIGVFAENREILADAMEKTTRLRDVLEVAAFNADGRPLLRLPGNGHTPSGEEIDEHDAVRAREQTPLPLVVDEPEAITVWAPVLNARPAAESDDLYFAGVPPNAPAEAAGFAALRISRRQLREEARGVLLRSVLVLGTLLFVAAAATALAVREAARPLAWLLAQVKEAGLPTSEASDDIGVLAGSFGHLVSALRDAIRRVAELTDGLEQQVAERTGELAAANRDLSDARDHLEERVRERTGELQRSHAMLLHAEKLATVGRLSASFAHEINNPIFAIQSVLHTLRSAAGLTPEELELLRAATDECGRVSRLVRDLQSFNRPSSGVGSVVQLDRLLDAVLLLCRRELVARKVTLEKSFAPDLPGVWGVQDQLKQVFLNLLTNAVDAMGESGGTLRVSTEATDTEVLGRVADTGSGIAPEHLGRVFDPFFTTKPEVKGTGLGLSISYQIIESHQGSIEVESRVGEGTTFTVRLPRPQGENP